MRHASRIAVALVVGCLALLGVAALEHDPGQAHLTHAAHVSTTAP